MWKTKSCLPDCANFTTVQLAQALCLPRDKDLIDAVSLTSQLSRKTVLSCLLCQQRLRHG